MCVTQACKYNCGHIRPKKTFCVDHKQNLKLPCPTDVNLPGSTTSDDNCRHCLGENQPHNTPVTQSEASDSNADSGQEGGVKIPRSAVQKNRAGATSDSSKDGGVPLS